MGKPAPTFWWDHDKNGDIIVQSDYDGGECLARFPLIAGNADMTVQVREADALIDDFSSGRKTPRWYIKA